MQVEGRLTWTTRAVLLAVLLLAGDPGSHPSTPERSASSSGRGQHYWAGRERSRPAWGASAALHDAGAAHSTVAAGARSGTSDNRQATSLTGSAGAGTGASDASGSLSAGGAGAAAGGAGAGGDQQGVCLDTCHLARNGICEDGSNMEAATVGGRTVGLQVACDFGTDCSDCGAYKGVVAKWGTDAGFQGPIDFLARQGVKVWARRVSFEPYFIFAYTDPKEDLDVSEQIDRAGCMELGIVQVFRDLLIGRCGAHKAAVEQLKAQQGAANAQGPSDGLPAQPLVVDVGANFGYFAVYAAVMGCRVIAVEPVPRFLAFLHWNLAANGIAAGDLGASPGQPEGPPPPVTVVPRAVMDVTNMNITVAAPRKGVWGTASVAGAANNIEQDLEMVSVPTISLDEVIGSEQVALLKVDVEGYEPVAIRSGSQALAQRRLENIVFEYSPGMPEQLERVFQASEWETLPVRAEDPPVLLQVLIDNGFTLLHLPDNFAKSGFVPQLVQPLPAFEEILRSHAVADRADVRWFRNASSASKECPWPPELVRVNPSWMDGCFKAPDDSDPKGFRSMFTYNTNIWAASKRSALQISGPVGLFGSEQDEKTTWSSEKRPTQGVGNRACEYLPADKLLRSRCRCTKPEACGLEQEAVLKALREGRMPTRPLEILESVL